MPKNTKGWTEKYPPGGPTLRWTESPLKGCRCGGVTVVGVHIKQHTSLPLNSLSKSPCWTPWSGQEHIKAHLKDVRQICCPYHILPQFTSMWIHTAGAAHQRYPSNAGRGTAKSGNCCGQTAVTKICTWRILIYKHSRDSSLLTYPSKGNADFLVFLLSLCWIWMLFLTLLTLRNKHFHSFWHDVWVDLDSIFCVLQWSNANSPFLHINHSNFNSRPH